MSDEAGGTLSILVATTSYPLRDGDFSGHFVHSLASAVVARGHRVTVVAPHAPGVAEAEELDGVTVRRFRYAPEPIELVAYGDGIATNLRRDARAWLALPLFSRALARAVAREAAGADVIHAQWAPTAAISARSLRAAPSVVTLHGSDVSLARGGGVWRALLDRGLAAADRVVTVARDQADFLRASGAYTGVVSTIPSGVPRGLLERPRLEPAAGAPFTFLYAGRLIAGKGVHELLEAFVRVARAHDDVRLVLVGTGPEEGALRERAVAGGVADRIDFRGAQDHASTLDAIAAADCFVLASHAEGSPLSVTEALALGTPVVGTRVGGVPDLLGDDGQLVEAGDVAGLAEAMMHVMLGSGLRAMLSREGRERVAARLTWDTIAERHERIYREAIEAAAGGGRRG
ncbi:MAG: glycosyltransferase [Coriobacteriia bacterium]|nr:glycosyltransferase [Coriobacteriia bacterium]